MIRMSEFEFDEWFKRTRKLLEEFDKLFEELMREPFIAEEKGTRKIYGPYYYGFSVTIGPDGIPRVKEWGNIRPGPIRPVIKDAIEPFTDVFDEGDYYRVIIDIPGVEKENINLEATEDKLIVSTKGERKYYKEIYFKEKVDPKTAKAQYKNGVLTITIEKKEKSKKEKGMKINIE